MKSDENLNMPLNTNINVNNLSNIKINLSLSGQIKQSFKKIHLTKWQLIRLGFVLLLLVGIALNTFLGFVFPTDDVACFDDKLFNLTKDINYYFSIHPSGKAALLIISSLFIDIMVFISFFHWGLYSTSWRLVFALLSFYVFRALNQLVFAMRFPDGYLWDNPGFPSLFVSYLRTRDFFYSGHVGFPIILGLEWNRLKKYYMQIICYLICALEFVTMIVLRGHYSIDLLSGVVFSHYFFILIEPLAKFVDDWRFMNMKENAMSNQVEPITGINGSGRDSDNSNKNEDNHDEVLQQKDFKEV